MPQITVRVTPRARRNAVESQPDGTYRVYTTAAPADGDANAAVIKMLGKYLGIAKSSLTIIRGHTSRDKVIEY